jgi:uncharacterized HAD superfamily protein
MGKIVLGLDLDGVLYPWHESVYTYYQWAYDYEKTYTEFWDDVQNWSVEQQDYLVSLPFLYENMIPSKQVIDFLEFANNNAEIYYITSRLDDLTRVTERYLRRYDFPQRDNLFVHYKGDKATICRYAGVTHFLDDHLKHVKSVSGIAESYLMAKPWNREFQSEFNTVHNLKEFQERVFK